MFKKLTNLFIINETKMFYCKFALLNLQQNKQLVVMRMQTYAANQMRDIEKFVNENGIDKKNIVDIFQSKEGDFVLVYYAE